MPDKQKTHQPLYEEKDRQSNKLSWISLFKSWQKKVTELDFFFFAIILDELLGIIG